MNLLSTKEAGENKGTSLQVILAATKRGEIDVVTVGGVHLDQGQQKVRQMAAVRAAREGGTNAVGEEGEWSVLQ